MPGPSLLCRLHALCWTALSLVQTKQITRLVAEADKGGYRVTIVVDRDDAPGDMPKRFPGRQFNSKELLIWRALSEREPLVGKQIAAATGLPYDSTLRVILWGMEDRGCIMQDEDGRGYRKASAGSGESE
jgi:hypothetical protein